MSNESEEVNSAHEPNTILLIPNDDSTVLAEDFTPSSSDDENNEKSKSKKRRFVSKKTGSDGVAVVGECSRERTELIHQALATLIATNQLPVSFCSSPGFGRFMAVVEPNYKTCQEGAMKIRLNSLKSTVEDRIKKELRNANTVVCAVHNNYRSSAAQNFYMSLTAHVIDDQWSPKSFTLAAAREMPEPLPAVDLSEKITSLLDDWEINGKITTVIADDEKNMVEAVRSLPVAVDRGNETDVTCAAHSLQLAVDVALGEQETFSELIKRCSTLVEHFEHSNAATKTALSSQQEQLGIHHRPLVQYCKTRWNSVYTMLDSVSVNRRPISNVLLDETFTPSYVARKLEITEAQWTVVETLVELLTPLNVVTNVFCKENYSPVSMVRPLLAQLLDKHLKPRETDDKNVKYFKRTIIAEIKERFKLDWNKTSSVSVKQIASFLDPRYKDLKFESVPAREEIRSAVKNLMEEIYRTQGDDPAREPQESAEISDLEFLYGNSVTDANDVTVQFQTYVAEPLLRYDLNPYEWWKSREHQYPALATLAKQYFAIPASSVSYDRCFSTAGCTVTSKNTCSVTNNFDMLIFLYQNRNLLP